MRAIATTRWFQRSALVLLFSAATAMMAAAQTSPSAQAKLEDALRPGMTVWITDSTGREQKTRIVGVSGDLLTTATDGNVRSLLTGEVQRVRTRQSDSLVNGAFIGAGAAVGSGLAFCRLMEPWEVCRGNVGSMLRTGAIGAAIGMGVDALIRGRKTIYEAARGTTRFDAAPLVGRQVIGLQLSLTF